MLMLLLPPPALRLPLLLSLLPSPSVLLLLLLQVLYNRKHKRCLYPPCGPNRSLFHHRPSCPRAVSVYQECPTGVNNTRSCSNVLLDQATVDCLAASDTSIIDHYHRCLLAVCGVDPSAMAPTLAYIEDNCGEDEKFEALLSFCYSSSVLFEIAATDNTSQLCQMFNMRSLVLTTRHNSVRCVA